jgi:hypothetical protein
MPHHDSSAASVTSSQRSYSDASISSAHLEAYRQNARDASKHFSITEIVSRARSKSPNKKPRSASKTTTATQKTSFSDKSGPDRKPSSNTATVSPTREHFLKKRPAEHGSTDHYGRHSNDWLFGNISLRETAKGIVRRNA